MSFAQSTASTSSHSTSPTLISSAQTSKKERDEAERKIQQPPQNWPHHAWETLPRAVHERWKFVRGLAVSGQSRLLLVEGVRLPEESMIDVESADPNDASVLPSPQSAVIPSPDQAVIKIYNSYPADQLENRGRSYREQVALSLIQSHTGSTSQPVAPRLLDHNVGTLQDARSDGTKYLILEYLSGKNMFEYCTGRAPLFLSAAIIWMKSVLALVAQLHAWGICHRDIKHDNIFVVPYTQVENPSKRLLRFVILDFGIAFVNAREDTDLELDANGIPEDFETSLDTTVRNKMVQDPLLLKQAAPGAEAMHLQHQRRQPFIDTLQCCALFFFLMTQQNYGNVAKHLHRTEAIQNKLKMYVSSSVPSQTGQQVDRIFAQLLNVLNIGLHPDPEQRYQTVETFQQHLEQLSQLVHGKIKPLSPRTLMRQIEKLSEDQQNQPPSVNINNKASWERAVQKVIRDEKSVFNSAAATTWKLRWENTHAQADPSLCDTVENLWVHRDRLQSMDGKGIDVYFVARVSKGATPYQLSISLHPSVRWEDCIPVSSWAAVDNVKSAGTLLGAINLALQPRR